MPTSGRLTAVLLAVSLGWAGLALGVTPPAASAAEAAPAPAATSAAADAPQDPATYYAGTQGLIGRPLAARLHTIVSGHTRLSYAQLWDALPVTDADPADPSRIIDFYSGASLSASAKCNTGGSCAGRWNREHSWAKSHGDFGESTGPGTDLFHMRPELANVNSSRGNLDFDDGGAASISECPACRRDSDSFEPRAAIKGDVARGLFYMAIRYDGGDGFADLELNDATCNSGSKAPNHGKLSTLVAWSLADPPDALERQRNDIVDGRYQHNRNPFIDHPEWVQAIWGDGVGAGRACGSSTGGVAPTPIDPGTPTDPTDPGTPTDPTDPGTPTDPTDPTDPGTPTDPGPPTDPVPSTGDLVIAEAYVNGGTVEATYRDKFVELYNPLASAVDLAGSSLQYRTATGTGVATGVYAFPAGAEVGPQARFVVRVRGNGDSGGALPTVQADAGSALAPAGGGGTLYLAATTAAVRPQHGAVGDVLGWGSSNAPETTAAGGHGVTRSLQRDAAGTDTGDNHADFTAASPTPGAAPLVNRAPSVQATALSTTAGTPVVAEIAATDPDGDPVVITDVSTPTRGTVTHEGLTLTYTPAVTAGAETLVVTVADDRGATATAEVAVEITARAAHLTLSAPTATRGSRTTVTIAAGDPASTDGRTPTGVVTLRSGTTPVGSAVLGADGTASVSLVPGRAGVTRLTASYAGDDLYAPTTSAPAALSVARSTARLGFSAGPLRRGRPGVLRVSVRTVAGAAATGTVSLGLGARTLTARVVRGTATFRVKALPRAARLRVTARYAGDTQYAAASAGHVYRLRR